MIITFSGMPGSGKSTLAKSLAEELGWKRYYMGGIMRDLAKKHDMSIIEYQKLGEQDPNIDKEIDDYQVNLSKSEDNIIIEGRTSAFLIPQSVKIFVDVDIDEAAKRVFNDLNKDERSAEEKVQSPEEMKSKMLERMDTERKRYKKYHNIEDTYDKSKFDIIIDTTGKTKEETFQILKSRLKPYMKQ
ncbi:cytidylate kinase family protein [Candidatus Woesearchaeota archaeon]|nr:cytidylate kinase family protein [Candidatus Woesearchaeota archaeon]